MKKKVMFAMTTMLVAVTLLNVNGITSFAEDLLLETVITQENEWVISSEGFGEKSEESSYQVEHSEYQEQNNDVEGGVLDEEFITDILTDDETELMSEMMEDAREENNFSSEFDQEPQLEVASAKLTVMDDEIDVFESGDYSCITKFFQVVISYANSPYEEVIEWDKWIYEAEVDTKEQGSMSENKSYLWAMTDNGNRVELTCWTEDGEQQLCWPIGANEVYLGSYKIKMTVDGEASGDDGQDVTIAIPNAIALTDGQDENCDIAQDGCRWYSFAVGSEMESEYVVTCKDEEINGDDFRLKIYSWESETLRLQDYKDLGSGEISFRAKSDNTYYIVVYADNYNNFSEWFAGTIAVRKMEKMDCVSAELKGIESGDIIDPYRLSDTLCSLSATIYYRGGSTEEIFDWDSKLYSEEALRSQALYKTIGDGDEAYLTLWVEDRIVSFPIEKSDPIPIGDDFTIKLIIGGEIKAEIPEIRIVPMNVGESLQEGADGVSYNLDPHVFQWYTFSTNTAGEFAVMLGSSVYETNGRPYLSLYKETVDGSVKWLNYESSIYDSALEFKAEKDAIYHIVLQNVSGLSDEMIL